MARIMRRRQRRPMASIPEITLTPLIDTALTLLVIFMVTTPMLQNAIKVQLPQGNAKEDIGLQEDVIVHIDKQQQVYINGDQVKREQLMDRIKQKVSQMKNKTVYVKADEAVQYGYVIGLVDQIKVVGGIEYVALATKKA